MRTSQRGAALLTAMLIVTLVATLASAMVWRQYRAVQIEAAERARAQSAWILQGVLDWARLILREDARANLAANTPVDHLDEVWAVPLAEARLSTFLAAESGSGDEGPEAFLSGSLHDAQAQYNLRHLLGGTEVPALELRVLERLCEGAGVPPGTALLISQKLRRAYPAPATAASTGAPAGAAGTDSSGPLPLQPRNLDQLRWFGLSAETIERLRPVLTLLPDRTPVNLNTAPREVIAALFDGMDLASAERLVRARKGKPLSNVQDAKPYLPQTVTNIAADRVDVKSSFFIIKGRLRLDERVLEERALVQRKNLDMVVLERQRANQLAEQKP